MNDRVESATREAIIEAARDLLVEGGVDALSMRKIGMQVGVSATAIYRHFEDKDALLSAAVSRGAQVFAGYLIDALSHRAPMKRLRRMGQRYFDFAKEHPHDYQLLFMFDCDQSNMNKLDEKTREETQQTFVMLVDRVVECQHSGDIVTSDPVLIAVYIWSSYHGLASLRINGRIGVSDSEFDQLVAQQIELTLASVRLQRPTARAAGGQPERVKKAAPRAPK